MGNNDISKYEEAVKYLIDIPKFNKNKNGDNTREILKLMGNPQDSMKIIHVAGTNGKGSTCAFINSILSEAGYVTGVFTSPHLVKINERFSINRNNVSDEEFLTSFKRTKKLVDENISNGGFMPSFFEYMFLIAMDIFKEKAVDVAILEVGLGGRLDATNVIEKKEVAVITSVSRDHMEILGDKIEDIAFEKAGIIARNTPVVFYGENRQVLEVIKKVASQQNSKTFKVTKEDIIIKGKTNKAIDFCLSNSYDEYGVLTVPFVMEYQTINAALAIKAVEVSGIKVSAAAIRAGIKKTVWSCRMEQVRENVYIDGAHNYEGMQEFVSYVKSITADKKAYILFSVVKEKEYHEMMDLILNIDGCKAYLVAPVANARAAAMDELAGYLEKSGKPVYRYESLREAFLSGLSMKKTDEYLFCVGSLYMAGEIKKLLEEKND